VVALHAQSNHLFAAGTGLTWVVCLPCWLLGCLLAERQPGPAPSQGVLVAWRLGIVGLSVAGTLLLTWLPGIWFLLLFGVVAARWLALEIDGFRVRAPWAFLEGAGAMSYSLYLTHRWILILIPLPDPVEPWLFALWRLFRIVGGLVLAYGFYAAIERPSHQLSRRIRRRSDPALVSQ